MTDENMTIEKLEKFSSTEVSYYLWFGYWKYIYEISDVNSNIISDNFKYFLLQSEYDLLLIYRSNDVNFSVIGWHRFWSSFFFFFFISLL